MSNDLYIVFEGVVGTGKSTQSKLLLAHLKKQFPDREVVLTREPGGSEIADAIRTLVQATPFVEAMEPVCEAYLYAASRAQSLRAVVKPVLDRGGIVISDRSVFSSVAWQGFGRGLGLETILRINAIATEGLHPDLVLCLDLNPAVAKARTFDADGDKFESLPSSFFERCRKGYRVLSEHPEFRERWRVINAEGTVDEVFHRILANIAKSLPIFNVL